MTNLFNQSDIEAAAKAGYLVDFPDPNKSTAWDRAWPEIKKRHLRRATAGLTAATASLEKRGVLTIHTGSPALPAMFATPHVAIIRLETADE